MILMPDYFHKKLDHWEHEWIKYPSPYNLNINWTVDRVRCFYCKTPIYGEIKAIKNLDGQVISHLCSICAEKIEVTIKKKDETN